MGFNSAFKGLKLGLNYHLGLSTSPCARHGFTWLPHRKEMDCFLCATKDEVTCESTLWSETTNVLLQFGQLFVHRTMERNRYCVMSSEV
jgi:hypothetical protein